jgi:hypothetical protein
VPAADPVTFIHAARERQYWWLPRALLLHADAATNGELFWPARSAADAARALAAQDRLITGVEVYVRRAIGWAAFLGAWEGAVPSGSGGWTDAVNDALSQVLHLIEQDPESWGEPDASRDDLRFFFASVPTEARDKLNESETSRW